MSEQPSNVVFSNFVSARSLRRGLARLGEALHEHGAAGPFVPPLSREPRRGDRLFFTDESGLGRYLGREGFEFHPRRVDWPLDDKFAFVGVVRAAGGDPVPGRPLEELDRIERFPIILKGRHSWVDDRPHPRGAICRSAADVRAALDRFAREGFPASGFYLQAWIPDGVTNCWSVSGWFDAERPEREALLVTQKLAATRDGLGYALLVGTMPDPGGLVERSRRLLAALRYTGPFELEFLHDSLAGTFHELELNPRFWLQHSVFVEARDNVLLRRYLGREDGAGAASRDVLWVSGVGLLTTLARSLQPESRAVLGVVRDWRRRGAQILVDPPLPVALRLLLADAWRRVRARIGVR